MQVSNKESIINLPGNGTISIEYYNDFTDGLNNLTFKFNDNKLSIYCHDDLANEHLVKVISFDKLLELGTKKIMG